MTVAEFLEIWSKVDAAGIQKDVEATGTFDPAKYPNAKRATEEIERVAGRWHGSIMVECYRLVHSLLVPVLARRVMATAASK